MSLCCIILNMIALINKALKKNNLNETNSKPLKNIQKFDQVQRSRVYLCQYRKFKNYEEHEHFLL